jgi:hypothetical protein
MYGDIFIFPDFGTKMYAGAAGGANNRGKSGLSDRRERGSICRESVGVTNTADVFLWK